MRSVTIGIWPGTGWQQGIAWHHQQFAIKVIPATVIDHSVSCKYAPELFLLYCAVHCQVVPTLGKVDPIVNLSFTEHQTQNLMLRLTCASSQGLVSHASHLLVWKFTVWRKPLTGTFHSPYASTKKYGQCTHTRDKSSRCLSWPINRLFCHSPESIPFHLHWDVFLGSTVSYPVNYCPHSSWHIENLQPQAPSTASTVKQFSVYLTFSLSSMNWGQHSIVPVAFVHVKSINWQNHSHDSLLAILAIISWQSRSWNVVLQVSGWSLDII